MLEHGCRDWLPFGSSTDIWHRFYSFQKLFSWIEVLQHKIELALCIQSGSFLLAFTRTTFVHQAAICRRVIHHSREPISTAPESSAGVLYATPADLALHIVISGLCVAARPLWLPWKPNQQSPPTNSPPADVASRSSLEQ